MYQLSGVEMARGKNVYNKRFGRGATLRIVVSGAAGFIGSHMCDRLLAEGHSVVGLDNLLTGLTRNIEHLSGNKNFQFILHDVTEPVKIEGPVDSVLHMASPASPKDYLEFPVETLHVGSLGTRQMLELARAKDARFLVTSTSESYGDPQVHPQVETYWGNVNPVGPRSCYDESKRFAEAITMAYHRKFGLRTNIARIFNTYGPRMKLNDGRIVPAFVDQALKGLPMTVFGDGTQTRSFCYVSDMVDGLYRLSQSDEPYPVNLGNPREMTVLEFAEAIRQLTGGAIPVVYQALPEDDPKQRKPDITKAKNLLGWEPLVDLEEGLKLTLDYFSSICEPALA
jgi:dTDP-glucose 4,6-dehydratase